MTPSYQEFLKSKIIAPKIVGFEVALDDIHPVLFDWQRTIARWAVKLGRAALFEDTGLGKTLQQIEWARHVTHHTGGRVLIVCPLAVAHQTIAEGRKIGVEIKYVRGSDQILEADPAVVITNYDMLKAFDPALFAGVVLDECFPAGTPIDTPKGTVPIERVSIGDIVENAVGVDRVVAKKIRSLREIVRIRTTDGREIYCSKSHPFFSMRGLTSASMLKNGDYLYGTREAMRMVREKTDGEEEPILRQVVLGQLAYATAGNSGEGAQQRSARKNWEENISLVAFGQSEGKGPGGTYSEFESIAQTGCQSQNLSEIEGDESQACRSRGQRERANGPATDTGGTSWRRMVHGIRDFVGQKAAWISESLQSRYCESLFDGPGRDRRILSRQPSPLGSEKRREAGGAWVESVQIYKSGDSEFSAISGGKDSIVFYDIQIEKHPSYSVCGLLVHNSSILKNYTGMTKRTLIEMFRETRFKLCCTATPAPNDYLELGNHSEFLGVMDSNEMIARWFINDTMQAGNYRLKSHARKDYWRWLTSWAVCISKPSDIGYSDEGFDLPPLKVNYHQVSIPPERGKEIGKLFFDAELSATGLWAEKRATAIDRCAKAAEIVASDSENPWIVWCDTNQEADLLQKSIPDAIEVRGSHSREFKIDAVNQFLTGDRRILLSKSEILGFGLNFQHCHDMIFVGVNYSFEKLYQALRRSWRYGQRHPVAAHIVYAESEGDVVQLLAEKEAKHKFMQTEMNEAMAESGWRETDFRSAVEVADARFETGEDWRLYLGDCVNEIRHVESNSVRLTVFSPPFSNLYIYSDSLADMGNSADDEEFFKHFCFLIPELYRITFPGRLCAVHCKDLPLYRNRDGAAGLRDFPGRIIRAFEGAGWIYHSRVTIWKDPVIEMQRTKNHGLLYKNLRLRGEVTRQGMADYLVVFRKWEGVEQTESPVVVTHDRSDFPLEQWQRWASPVWMDIDQTDVLNYQPAREPNDQRHICPLQLGVIERCVRLWSNKDETVFSPFAGIGSEGYVALREGRKFIGVELKESYWKVACDNLKMATSFHQPSLFKEVREVREEVEDGESLQGI